MVLEVVPVFPHDDIGKAEEHKISFLVSVVVGEDPSLGECKGC